MECICGTELEEDYSVETTISGDWVEIIVICGSCGAEYEGSMQLAFFDLVE